MSPLRSQKTSAVIAVLGGSVVYVVASFAQRNRIDDALNQFEAGKTVALALYYIVILLSGFVAGRLHPRNCVVLGFLAGYFGRILYNLVLLMPWAFGSGDESASLQVGAYLLVLLTHSIPVAILAAAGGALGALPPSGKPRSEALSDAAAGTPNNALERSRDG